MAAGDLSFSGRARQAWTIAAVELRRVFFARHSLWVYVLALLPSVIFFGHGVEVKLQGERLSRRGLAAPALMDSIRKGEAAEEVKKRLGTPAEERWSVRSRRVRQHAGNAGTTTHVIEPAVEGRFVRLNVIRPSYNEDPVARIYEFEVYGPDGARNLALGRPATGSLPCSQDQGPEKAVNGSVAGGETDRWCGEDRPLFLQVDLGAARPVARFVVKHASAGGESEESDTREFNIQVSTDGKNFTTVETSSGAGFVEQRTEYRQITYFDGRRAARLTFVDGKLDSWNTNPLLNFEEDRTIFAGIFQFFYLRLAVFFGCLGMFVYLFRGEMTNRTLHYWFLAPARREVLLAGKYAAGSGRIRCHLRRRRARRLCGYALAARPAPGPGLLERRGHGTRVLVRGGGRARLRGLRERLSGARPVRAQSHDPGRGAAGLGGGERRPPARAAEDERALLPAVALSRPCADGR